MGSNSIGRIAPAASKTVFIVTAGRTDQTINRMNTCYGIREHAAIMIQQMWIGHHGIITLIIGKGEGSIGFIGRHSIVDVEGGRCAADV